MTGRFYFAYGSNLNAADWRAWCHRVGFSPDLLVFRSIADLPDWELSFDYHSSTRRGGALDLRRRTGQLTAGAIFEVRDGGWEALDDKEGAPHCYHRQEMIALTPDSEPIPVTSYVVRPERRERFVRPTPEYIKVVRDGLAEHDLPDAALEAAARGQLPPWEVDGLFVYGTLMRDEPAFAMLEPFGLSCTLLASAPGRLVDMGSFPGLVPPESEGDFVRGDFLRLSDVGGALGRLDRYEGFQGYGHAGSLFRRTLAHVDVGDGRIRRAWCYVLDAGTGAVTPVPSGDWREHRGRRAGFLRRLVAAHVGGDEEGVAMALARRIPFAFGSEPEDIARTLRPLADAVARDVVSERRLAQETGNWVTLPGLKAAS